MAERHAENLESVQKEGMVDPYAEIGRRIKEAREAAGMSQEELGEKIGDYSASAISYFESGNRKIKIEDLEKISHLLGKPVDYFLAGDRYAEKPTQLERGLALTHLILEMVKKLEEHLSSFRSRIDYVNPCFDEAPPENTIVGWHHE